MQVASQVAPAAAASAGPPTVRLACRFYWKECRRLAGLTLGIAGIALAVMLALVAVGPVVSRAAQMLIVAFGGSAMLAIASAVTLFALEQEEGTADLLRRLPKNRVGVLMGKWFAAVTAVVSLLVVLTLAAYLIAGGWPSGSVAALISSQGATILAEALVLGILASLLCRSPLVAAVLGIIFASLNSQLAIALFVPTGLGYEAGDLQTALPARWVLLAVAMALDSWLAVRWLATTPAKIRRTPARAIEGAAAVKETRQSWRAAFFRLIWQSARQSWGVALAVSVLGVFLTGTFFLVLYMVTDWEPAWRPLGVLGLLFTPALLGAMVFRADQRQAQYRFLSEHAGPPNAVWLARVVTWAAPVILLFGGLCITAGAIALSARDTDRRYYRNWAADIQLGAIDTAEVMGTELQAAHDRQDVLRGVLLVFSATLAAFCYGQFFSIALRSEILAAMLAIVASVLLALWAVIIGLTRLPILWFLWPLAAGALLASWLRTRDWMLDRKGLIRWAIPLAALLVPIFLVLKAAPTTRQSQVPPIYSLPQWSGERSLDLDGIVANAERQLERGREVAAEYQRLASQIDEATYGTGLAAEDFQQFVELTKEDCRLPPDFAQYGAQRGVIDKLRLATLSERWGNTADGSTSDAAVDQAANLDPQLERLLACGRLDVQQSNGQGITDAVFPGYLSQELVDWATADGPTVERLLHAIDALERIENKRLGPADRLTNEYLRVRSIIRGEAAPSSFGRAASGGPAPRLDEWCALLANDLPGESARAERALEILASALTRYLRDSEVRLASEGSDVAAFSATGWRRRHRYSLAAMLAANQGFRDFDIGLHAEANHLVRHAQTSYLVAQEFTKPWSVAESLDEWVSAVAWWRAERVRLALIAYRLRHGSYPETLHKLSPDFLSPEQYRDPFGTGPYGYSAEGLPHRTSKTWMYRSLERTDHYGSIPAGTPLLWSSGTGGAIPTVALARYEQIEGSRVETIVREGDSPDDENEPVPVMVLRPKLRSWGWHQFWMPLPK